MKTNFFFFFLFLFCITSYSQSISGIVVDEIGEPLIGVSVSLTHSNITFDELYSDLDGKFVIDDVPNGSYRLKVKFVGYNEYERNIELLSNSLDLEITLSESMLFYDPVIIACGFRERITIHPLKTHILTQRSNSIIVDQYSKDIAGTFGDPSRVLLRHTGISTQNDQANGIVYRGLPSDNINWTISGAEIVNPNHLSNAGTLSDQSSASAGGVLAFPMETISRFQFSGQPYGSQMPNALAGVADLNFNSNFRNRNSFFKLGLLGLEAGYVSDKKVKVNAHARYSTVGLLSDLGVDFDGESIKFQDVFLNVEITNNLQFVGLLANSTNDKVPIENPEMNATEKDLSQINYKSDIMIHGLRFTKSKHSHSLFFSTKKDSREVLFESELSSTRANDMKLSYHGDFRFSDWKAGINATYYDGLRDFSLSKFDDSYLTFQPYMTYNKMRYFDAKTFNIVSSLSMFYDTYNRELTIEPYLQLQYSSDPLIIEFNASKKSQMLASSIYGQISNENYNQSLQRSKTVASSLSLKYKKDKYRLMSRAFYQYIYDLPAQSDLFTGLLYSPVMNGISFLSFGELDRISTGQTYGIELMADFDLGYDFYLNANATFFEATYDEFNATNNFGQIFNLTMTKEFGDHFLVNIAAHYRGGAFENLPQFDAIYQSQLSDYYRIDVRVAYSWSDNNELSLDIQNVTNRLNDAYFSRELTGHMFSGPSFSYTLEKQLGIIPILSYKRIIN